MEKIDFRAALNDEQYVAVTAPDGPILVLAAAGTGKTRTLVYRVAYLVEKGISPERILLLTFTNRAAAEMLERAQKLVGNSVGGIWGGTFHHMCNRILRRHAAELGYTNRYTILDRDDSRSLVAGIIKERKLNTKEFPKAEVLLGIFGNCVNTSDPLDKLLEERFVDYQEYAEQIAAIRKEYETRKRSMDAMDFDDLLVNCHKLLSEYKWTLDKYQDQFLHVLVDEYQDTNWLQARLVDLIGGKHKNVMVVGDDFQSIYSWRGADYRNIMSFTERYGDARTYMLETNYRSVPEILEVANACIAGNPEQYQKTLRATRDAHHKPVVARIRDGEAQARFIAECVRLMLREGHKPADIAVLYRAHFHAMELQMTLAKERIPYIITSGIRFFEQAHIKDICSVLRLIENPADEMSFVRLMGMLPGVGLKTAEKIWAATGRSFRFADPDCRKKIRLMLRPGAQERWDAVAAVFEGCHDEGLREDPGEVLYRFMSTFYARYLADNFEDYDRRADDINEMILYMAKYESVEQFLADVALLTNLDAETESIAEKNTDAVRLTTVHQAKGLEWPVVIIIWLTENMFPSGRALAESPDAEAEERRLFYVAVTRAKDELVMCVPEVRRMPDGGVMYCATSRFLEEVPSRLVRQRNVGFV